jgi:site-specific DNA-methyltransferase (adenine-specific)/modification methylase
LTDCVTIGNARLYLGDSREILPTLGHVDAVVTDPPYGIDENGRKNKSRGARSAKWKRVRPRDYGDFNWDKETPPAWLFALLREMSDWQIVFGGNFFDMPPSSCWLVWDKQNTGDFADAEMAWTNLEKAVRLIQWRWNGFSRKGSDVREHPTQKPEGVMAWCIDHLPADVQTVLDPFMGSGTTGVAALRRGKKFIGIEKVPEYFEIACRRLEAAGKQGDLLIEEPKLEPVLQALGV